MLKNCRIFTFTTFFCRGAGLCSSTQPRLSASFRASNFLLTSSTCKTAETKCTLFLVCFSPLKIINKTFSLLATHLVINHVPEALQVSAGGDLLPTTKFTVVHQTAELVEALLHQQPGLADCCAHAISH